MDLFDVANTLKDTKVADHCPNWQDASGSYRPLANQKYGFVRGMEYNRYSTVNDNGERVMFVSTDFGNIVLHERSRTDNFVVAIAPKAIQPLLGNGKLNDDQIAMVLGLWGKDNIGQVLANLTAYKQEKVA